MYSLFTPLIFDINCLQIDLRRSVDNRLDDIGDFDDDRRINSRF